jgi:hypothetical protein
LHFLSIGASRRRLDFFVARQGGVDDIEKKCNYYRLIVACMLSGLAEIRVRRVRFTSFFFEDGAMNFIEKSAIIRGEYWVRVYPSRPNFAQ